MPPDPLPAELRALGRSLDDSTPPALADAVMARVRAEPVRSWRRRVIAGAVAGLVLAGALTPPVRAAVLEWLGVVVVREIPGTPPTDVSVPAVESGPPVDFPVLVPRALGEPRAVEVSADRLRVSMSWDGVRLDQVAGTLAPHFWKSVYVPVQYTRVAGGEALWLASAHQLEVVGIGGAQRIEPPRLAGPTLIWVSGGVTYRLEGIPTRERAVTIAESIAAG